MPTGKFERTEKHKRNISLALTGKHKSVEHKKKLSEANKGKKHTEEERQKIGEGVRKYFGFGMKEWTGGSIYYWTKCVKERDNYTCQKCGNNDKRVLCADHIKSKSIYPELKLDVSNGMTLCQNCHAIKTYEDKEYRNFRSVNHYRSKTVCKMVKSFESGK